MMGISKQSFPFAAIVGQERLKTAYLANIVNPSIGGLLISGPKGTGKSTIVHSVGDILSSYDVVAGCQFNCDPKRPDRFCTNCHDRDPIESQTKPARIVTLPLSCTEDRLIGSVDIETLLKTSNKEVQVGILGQAHRNILYVDEVNLLPDHLVDDILDAAASPWNTIEREGVSITHPADFVLVGTMNPEEGELRPQILDRFPLCAQVQTVTDPEQRAEIVKRNLLYDASPTQLNELFAKQQEAYAAIVQAARTALTKVAVGQPQLMGIAEACATLKVDGQRPDIVIVKTAMTIAAMDGRAQVLLEDILLAAELALCHRTRDGGLLDPPTEDEIKAAFLEGFKNQGALEIVPGSADGFTGNSIRVNQKLDSFLVDGKSDSETHPSNKSSGLNQKKN